MAGLAAGAAAHGDHGHEQEPIAGPHKGLWYNTLPGDGGTQAPRLTLVLLIVPGLVLALRAFGKVQDVLTYSSRRVGFSGGYNVPLDTNPFNSWARVLDCGDIPVTSYDNSWAIQQIEDGHNAILSRRPHTSADKQGPALKGRTLPRVITLGGDHTIVLPILRSVNRNYGPVSVIHFDSHLDTWKPKVFGGSPTKVASVNHGTYFYHASQEGLLANDTNIHVGIRTTLSGPSDYENDGYCGFEIIEARDIDTIGIQGIIDKIKARVGLTKPVYLSIDIDTLDPAFAPATGTPETGGWSTRELRTIIRGLEGINLIGADIVEVAPAYDTNAEHTTMAAADTLYEVMSLMVKKGPLSNMVLDQEELHDIIPYYRQRAHSRVYGFLIGSQSRRIQKRAAGKGVIASLQRRGRRVLSHSRKLGDATSRRLGMSQSGSAGGGWGGHISGSSSAPEGRERGARRRKIAGYLKAANELRQSYQQSYGRAQGQDSDMYEGEQGIPGAFPDVEIVRSGDEEMVLFPSYARRHVKKDLPAQTQQPASDSAEEGSGGEGGDNIPALDGDYWREQWERREDDKAIVDVDVHGWIYSPSRGPMSRRNRILVGLARRLSGIPAPSNGGQYSGGGGSDGVDDDESHLGHRERAGARHEEDLIKRQADSILRRGEGEADVAGRGGYSEDPATDSDRTGTYSDGSGGDTPAWSSRKDHKLGRGRHPSIDPPSQLDRHSSTLETPAEGSPLSQQAIQSSQMTPAELSAANAHLMARLKPFLTAPLVNTAVTVFFYNSQTSQSRTIITNDAGHFLVRASLEFVPTHVRVLASENLSATEEIQITEPTGISMISDIDDTIKHSAIGSGAREMFRNTFIRELGDLTIEGVKEWYNKLAEMGVGIHYVSNSPWQLYPLLTTYFAVAGLPPGSFHLKQYSGMLQGIFEPVAERKKGTLEKIIRDFPDRKFLLVGDSGEADLEVYTDIVSANPGRIVGIFIRDITTTRSQGFFDSAMGSLSGDRSETNNGNGGGKISGNEDAGLQLDSTFERKPTLPPRPAQPELLQKPSGPTMGKLIDFDEGDSDPTPLGNANRPLRLYRSMTEHGTSNTGRRLSAPSLSTKPHPPIRPSKPLALRGSLALEQVSTVTVDALLSDRLKKPPPVPPKPQQYLSSEQPASEPKLVRTASMGGAEDSPVHRHGYMPNIRGKVSSVYNSLPSASDYWYGKQPNNQGTLATLDADPRSETAHTTPPGASKTLHPTTPRRGLAAYPVAAAQYATNRLSGGWSGTTNNTSGTSNASINNGGGATKEELWKRRWARAKSVLDKQGVALVSWRTGGDAIGEAVRLVERVRG
ncbi:hypothetical protein FGG08_004371 [Glutinoglossum americanum]|uniref:Phosphatidate phosphatase APP1 catalytic domain-containing protein n=1 Tax=Glutinoglossum americanum TaxID=1670608 RepID=A0A9P8HWK3_9PEZI|nr:hypothetical protein FGG08_004371 [Glutinoglossum americanum]